MCREMRSLLIATLVAGGSAYHAKEVAAQRPTLVQAPTPVAPPGVIRPSPPVFSVAGVTLTPEQLRRIESAVPAAGGRHTPAGPPTKPELGTFVHGPSTNDLYKSPFPVALDADMARQDPRGVDVHIKANRVHVFYYEYAALCADIARRECLRRDELGSAFYWAGVAKRSREFAGIAQREIDRLTSLVSQDGPPASPDRPDVPPPVIDPMDDPVEHETNPAAIQSQIKALDAVIAKLTADVADLRHEVATAEAGRRFTDAAAFRATLAEYQGLLAELVRQRTDLHTRLQEATAPSP